jgi:hypothetical protein
MISILHQNLLFDAVVETGLWAWTNANRRRIGSLADSKLRFKRANIS